MHSKSILSELRQYQDSEIIDISVLSEPEMALPFAGERNLVVADSGIEHLDLLLGRMDRAVDHFVVEPGMNLEEVFAHAFSGVYSAVHFLGHGAPGSITLAGRQVRVDEFVACATPGKTNFNSLHFWSCSTGYGSEGKQFVERISNAFGVGVTAFTGLVGAEVLGGSWTPDCMYGEISSVSNPFVNAAAYPATLSNLLSFEVVATTGGQNIKIWLAAGQSADSISLDLTYNKDQATYVSTDTSSLTGWTMLASESTVGEVLIGGYSLTPITAGADRVLLANITFTFKTGGTAVQPALITGTELTLNESVINLGTLPELVPPTITSFSSSTTDGGYFTGQTVNITATASEALQDGAQITVTLNSATGRTVTLSKDATDATKLVGTYTVQTGDFSEDLNVSSYTLGTGSAAPKDTAGNAMTSTTVPTGTSSLAGAKALVINPLAPTTTLSAIDISADTGDATDFITSTAAQTITATLSASLATGEKLYGSVDGGTTWTDISNKVSGTAVSWTGATLAGSSSIKLQVRDSNSNAGPTASQSYVLDATAPTITSFTSTTADGYYKVGDQINITATASEALQLGVQITATLNTGRSVTLTRDVSDATKLVGTYTVQSGDTSSDLTVAAFSLGTGSAAPKDVAGNSMSSATVPSGTNNLGGSKAIVIDTLAPTTTVNGIHLSADTGTSPTDFVTKTAAQTITATLSAALVTGEKLYGSVDGGTSWTDITSSVTGTAVSWSGATLSAGTSSIKFEVRDLAGNASTTPPQAYTLDTTAPATTISAVDISNDSGSSAADFITNSASQTITGTLSAALAVGERLKGSRDGGTTWDDITNKVTGTSFTITDAVLLSGSNTLKVKVVDAAGNDGPVDTQAYVLDTTAPAIDTTVSLPVFSHGNITVTFAENVELGSGSIVLHHGSDAAEVALSSVTISGHTVIIDPVDALTAGDTYSVSFAAGSVKDTAGNLNSADTYSFTPSASYQLVQDTGLGTQFAHIDDIGGGHSAKIYDTLPSDGHPFDKIDIVSTKQGDTYTDSYKVTWTDATHWEASEAYGTTTLHSPQLLLGEVSGTGANTEYTMSTLGVIIVGKTTVYSTISAALSAASDGDTILVGSGKYSEDITIDKAVKLIGANHDASAVKLDADGNPIPDVADNVRSNSESWINGTVTVKSSNVEINGFRLHNADGPLKFVDTAKGLDNLTLVDNFITGYYAGNAPTLGVQGEAGTNASGWTIEKNFIGGVITDSTHYGAGSLYLSGLADSSISGNAFWRPGAAHLYLSSLTNVTVDGNNFYHGVHAAGANFDGYADQFWGGDGYSGGTGYGSGYGSGYGTGYGYGYGYGTGYGYGYGGGDGGAYFGRNYWLELKGVNDGVYITGNTGSYNSGGIQLYGQTAGAAFDDIVISDNTFKDFINADPFGTLTDAASRHLSGLMGAVNISVSTGSTASDVLVKGNTVTMGADQVYSHYDVSAGVQVTGYVSDLVVQDNTLNWKSSEGINFTAGQTYVGSTIPTSTYITTAGTTIEGVGLYSGLSGVVDVAHNNISFQSTIPATGAGIYIDKQLSDSSFGTYNATTTITGDNTVSPLPAGDGSAVVLDNFGTSNTLLPTGITVKQVSGSAALEVYNADSGSFVSYTPTTQGNESPFVLNETESQSAEAGTAFSYVLPEGTFVDIFPSTDTLTYTATLGDGSALPSWLTFNARTHTFSGTPASGDTGTISVKVTATDTSNASAVDTFSVVVHETNLPPTSTNDSIVIGASGVYDVSVTDFGVYSDPNGDPLSKVKVTMGTSNVEYSPDGGTTWLPLLTGTVISRAQIDGVSYIRLASGTNEETISFQVSDGKLYSTASYSLNIYKESVLLGTTTTLATGAADVATTISDGTTQFISAFDVPAGVAVTAKEAGASFTVTDLMKLYLDQAGLIDSTSRASALAAIDSHVTNTDNFRYLKFDAAAGYDATKEIVLSGAAGTHEALVIDLSGLTGLPNIKLDNVDFAIIIGAGNFYGGAGSNIVVADDQAQHIVLGADDDTIYGGGGNDTIGSHDGNDVLYGDGGNDILYGDYAGDVITSSNDTIYGGSGNDTIYGGVGNDVLYGNEGNDSIDGGDGIDLAMFDMASTHYTSANVTYVAATDTWTLTSDTGEVDTLVHVETAQFSDGLKIDTAAPTVASYSPTNAATNVAVGSNIEITFSELIKKGAGNIEIHAGSATGALVERFNAATDTTHLTFSGTKLTIDPTANLSSGTDYYVTFDAGTIKDYLDFSNAASSSYHFQTVAQAAAAVATDSGTDTGAIVVGGVVAAGLIYWLLA